MSTARGGIMKPANSPAFFAGYFALLILLPHQILCDDFATNQDCNNVVSILYRQYATITFYDKVA